MMKSVKTQYYVTVLYLYCWKTSDAKDQLTAAPELERIVAESKNIQADDVVGAKRSQRLEIG
jgi:hypothetical protein